MAARKHLKAAKNVGEQPCDRGLSGSRVSREDEMAFQLHRLARIVPFLTFYAVNDGLDLLLDLRKSGEGVDLLHDLLLGEFLERLSRNVGLLDLGATTAEHVEGALLGDLARKDSVLLGSAVTEHLFENQPQPLLCLRTDRRSEPIPDQRHAQSLEIAVLE